MGAAVSSAAHGARPDPDNIVEVSQPSCRRLRLLVADRRETGIPTSSLLLAVLDDNDSKSHGRTLSERVSRRRVAVVVCVVCSGGGCGSRSAGRRCLVR